MFYDHYPGLKLHHIEGYIQWNFDLIWFESHDLILLDLLYLDWVVS